MIEHDFETALFKELSMTDADEGESHVSGILVLKEMRPYFPDLAEPSTANPAPSIRVLVTMIIPGKFPEDVAASYQYQSRGNSRAPESRLTGIEPLRKASTTGDFVLIERSKQRDDVFRIELVKRLDSRHAVLAKRRSGDPIVDHLFPPAPIADLAAAQTEIEARSTKPFELFDNQANLVQQQVRRVARARAFARVVSAAYGFRCAICGGGMTHPSGRSEIEAAHIVSRSDRGADDVRNGLALCRVHHWAFDNLLIAIRPNGSFEISPAVIAIAGNASLASLIGRFLIAPLNPAHAPHTDALKWASDRYDAAWA